MKYPIRFYPGDEMRLDIQFKTLEPVVFESGEDVMRYYLDSVLVTKCVPMYPYAAENWGLMTGMKRFVRGRVLRSNPTISWGAFGATIK